MLYRGYWGDGIANLHKGSIYTSNNLQKKSLGLGENLYNKPCNYGECLDIGNCWCKKYLSLVLA